MTRTRITAYAFPPRVVVEVEQLSEPPGPEPEPIAAEGHESGPGLVRCIPVARPELRLVRAAR